MARTGVNATWRSRSEETVLARFMAEFFKSLSDFTYLFTIRALLSASAILPPQ
jgi:hypothetical protein